MHRFLFCPIKNFSSYIILFAYFLLHKQDAIAQKNESLYDKNVFAKYIDATFRGYTNSKPYYVSIWSGKVPLIRVIRKLDEQLAIIEVPTQIAFDTLKRRTRIAPANDVWKLSPPAEKLVEKNKDEEREYILTGMKLDDLLTVLQNEQKQLTIMVVNKPAKSVIIKCRTKYVKGHLLWLKEVIFIDAALAAREETN
ncbi:MAG TPA: hypothetical protein VF700_05500, partial [Segetibacter sp.]